MKVNNYKELIKKGYINRVDDFRNFIYYKSLSEGENLMPEDIAEIMAKSTNSGKYKYLLFNGFTSTLGKLSLLFDIYESCGFEIPNKELTIINLQLYF